MKVELTCFIKWNVPYWSDGNIFNFNHLNTWQTETA